LIEIAKKLIVKHNIRTLDIKLSRSKENFWSELAAEYFNINDYNKSKLVKKYYETDRDQFATVLNNYIYTMSKNEELDSSVSHKENEFSVVISKGDWEEAEKCIRSTNSRKKFNKFFHEKLNQIIKLNGIKCYLICLNNYFSKNQTNYLWKGKYKCKGRYCSIKYSAIITKQCETSDIVLTVEWNGKSLHEDISKPITCSDLLRDEMKLHLMAKGQNVVASENFLKNLGVGEGKKFY